LSLINFMKSIENSFISKKHPVSGKQKEQEKMQTLPKGRPPGFVQAKKKEMHNYARRLQQVEKETVATRQVIISNSEGTPSPLTIRIPQRAPGKGKGKKPSPEEAGLQSFLFDLIIETENLGPILLRLDGEGGLYNCTFHAESKEVANRLYQDFGRVRPILSELLPKTGLDVRFFSPCGPESEHFIINTKA
jgi:hypothetical protein